MEQVRKLKRLATEIFLEIIKDENEQQLEHLIAGLELFKSRKKVLSDGK